jgi:hypothetical protein
MAEKSSAARESATAGATAAAQESMLVVEIRKTNRKLADKMAALDELQNGAAKRWEKLSPDKQHLTRDELKQQKKLALSAAERDEATAIEYGTFVAEEGIEVSPSIYAYGEGQPVPISAVEANGWFDEDPPRVRRVRGE